MPTADPTGGCWGICAVSDEYNGSGIVSHQNLSLTTAGTKPGFSSTIFKDTCDSIEKIIFK